ncbi:folate-binding protein YgfZ [Acidipila sp. EB88]|uniref:CAF17-like 4Fe-4S cluster assembly/insertion protein YgfZ n=1 Tax=Acidipila sp. EB88 TaxID=2305226 RepID=UPI0013158F3E|nr:folate-binding protein [Acidipila sp. EB88]
MIEETTTVPEQVQAELTPLARVLDEPSAPFAGVLTPASFSSSTAELEALCTAAGVYDLGFLARFRISGEDRVRWLNGMITNTVKDLEPGQHNYTFLLNAQGRIQGDGTVYALPEALLFSTDESQAARVAAHLDRFIIMDDVELVREPGWTALGLTGPEAGALLLRAGVLKDAPLPGSFVEQDGLLVARSLVGPVDQFVLWVEASGVAALWQRLLAAGAAPCGSQAVESLRVLAGIPRYGVDIEEKTLAQETGQMHALHFNKGCYLGQEIVERIRSRATVHRGIRVFRLSGELPPVGTALYSAAKPETAVGELTSITSVTAPIAVLTPGIYALGTVRTEAVATASSSLTYAGGSAEALLHAPLQNV